MRHVLSQTPELLPQVLQLRVGFIMAAAGACQLALQDKQHASSNSMAVGSGVNCAFAAADTSSAGSVDRN
jgi:hypothetical protein